MKFYLKRLYPFIHNYDNVTNFFLLNRAKSLQLNSTSYRKYLSENNFPNLWVDRINLNSFQHNAVGVRGLNKVLLAHANFRSSLKTTPRYRKLRRNKSSLQLKFKKGVGNFKSLFYSSSKLPSLLVYTTSKHPSCGVVRSSKGFLNYAPRHYRQMSSINLCVRKLKLRSNPNLVSSVYQKNFLYFYENNKYLYLFTRHRNSFVLTNLGIFIPSMFVYRNNSKLDMYILRKKMYSFLKINEYKMHIFRGKKSLMLNNIVSKIKGSNFFNRVMFTSHKVFYNYFRKIFFEIKDKLSNILSVSNVFLNEGLLSKSNLFRYGGNLVYNGLSYRKNSPPTISRVRFKPGYQRIWRHYRLALAESIDFNYIYQKQLTRFLVKFYRKSTTGQLSFNENIISRVAIYSRLVPDKFTFDLFFKNKLIFLNSNTLLSNTIYVYKNDFIQIEISN